MIRKCTDEDISDEELEKVINPPEFATYFFNSYFTKTYFLSLFLLHFISKCFIIDVGR